MTTSFFTIHNEDVLYDCPPDVLSDEWEQYIESQAAGSTYSQISSHPIQLDIELNGTCNMKCPFCIHGYGEGRRGGWIDAEYAYDLIKQAAHMGVRSMKFNYINEPLLRSDLEDYIRHARACGILNTYFVTNGTLLTKERSRSLIDAGVTKIFVSLDAATEETYNRQRRNGAYTQVIKNIHDFLDLRSELGVSWPLMRVSFLETQLNKHERAQFLAQWKGVVDLVVFQRMNEVPGHKTGLLMDLLGPPEYCSFPNKQLVVDSEGDILPCCKLEGKNLALGNIKETTLQQAWDSQLMRDLRHNHSKGDYAAFVPCRRCIEGQ